MDKIGWDLATSFEEHASKEAQSEATAIPTVPGGVYLFTPEKLEPVLTDEKSFLGSGVKTIQVTYAGLAQFTLNDKTPKKKFFVEYAIDEVRNPAGKLQGPSSLFLQAQKALDKLTVSKGETIEAIRLYPVNAFVTEVAVYKNGGDKLRADGSATDKYVTITPNASRVAEMSKHAEGGAQFRNFVQNVSKAK